MENENRSDRMQENEGQESWTKGKPFKEASPEEVRERVKETVQKGVAAVAGALKGFTEESKKHDLAKSTKQAIRKAGETARQVAGTATKEIKETRQHLKAGGASTTGAGPTTGTDRFGMGGSQIERSPVNEVPDLRKTELGSQKDIQSAKNLEEDFGE
jgi:hypothetical protein